MDYDYDISDIFSALKLDDEYFAGPRTVVKRSAADAKSSEEPPEKRQRKKYDYLSCLESLSDSDDSDDGPADIDPEILAFIRSVARLPVSVFEKAPELFFNKKPGPAGEATDPMSLLTNMSIKPSLS